MEPIKSTLKKWMRDNQTFEENYRHMKQEVLQDPAIKSFLATYPTLPEAEIEKNLMKLYEYKNQSKQCDQCASFGRCINMIQGYSPILEVENGEIHLTYEKCHNRLAHEKEREQAHLIKSLYMPKEILEANFEQIDTLDAGRRPIIRRLMEFVKATETSVPAKGFYMYGPFGIGKTYLLGALANELKKRHISSMLIYMPEFVREMKSSIKDDSINEKIEYFKNADILMLDDMGAETQSAWFRDEILGSILQYRMMERLPVFFTSNYSLEQLEKMLSTSNRGGVEEVKAGRILERVKQVSTEIAMDGHNRREQS